MRGSATFGDGRGVGGTEALAQAGLTSRVVGQEFKAPAQCGACSIMSGDNESLSLAGTNQSLNL